MGDGTQENPYTRDDVLKLIEENGGKARGLDLSGKVFEEGIDLSGLDLERIVLLRAILRKANLKKAKLSYADLRGAELYEANLKNALLFSTNLERAELIAVTLEGAWLANTNLSYAILTDTDLGGTEFYRANLEGITLSASEVPSNAKFDRVLWGNFVLGEEEKGDFYWAEDTCRQLKRWYTNAGIYNIAGEFFYREMEIKKKRFWWGDYRELSLRDTFRTRKIKKIVRFIIPQKPFHWAWSQLISILCGYGERPSRVVISAIVVIFGLAVAYLFGGLSLPYSIYFSAVSFTALGYGTWAYTPPENWVQGVGAFESYLGVFMMALFLITFVRKMTR